ncbi:unnamed protein product [Trichobilharzia szidati]|nr:unnamed protein product [Trichobilharzia szidati]
MISDEKGEMASYLSGIYLSSYWGAFISPSSPTSSSSAEQGYLTKSSRNITVNFNFIVILDGQHVYILIRDLSQEPYQRHQYNYIA